MFSLDPAKLLVVLVVALVVLGPDKLPRAARQAGAAWNQLRRWRARLEDEVRSTFPDLPAAHTITEAMRSPLSFLDRLADDHERTEPAAAAPGAAAGSGTAAGAGARLGDGTGASNGAAAPAAAGTDGGTGAGTGGGPLDADAPAGDGEAPGPERLPEWYVARSRAQADRHGRAQGPAGEGNGRAPGPAGDGVGGGTGRHVAPRVPGADPGRWSGDPAMN